MVEKSQDIYSKMSSEPVGAVLVEEENRMIREGVFTRTDPKLWPKICPIQKFNYFPRALEDDWTGVWISLSPINDFRTCGHVISVLDPFPNCVMFDGNRLNHITKGAYFMESLPSFTIPLPLREGKELFENLEKLREKIKDILQNKSGQKLLIVYDSNDESIKVYESFQKVEFLRFESVIATEELGEYLHVLRVPRLEEKIPYEFVKNIKIYGHDIKFSKEIVRFRIYTRKGRAELIFNPYDEDVRSIIDYPASYHSYHLTLEPRKLYLFIQRRPDWARYEAEEEYEWMKLIRPKKE